MLIVLSTAGYHSAHLHQGRICDQPTRQGEEQLRHFQWDKPPKKPASRTGMSFRECPPSSTRPRLTPVGTRR